MKIYNVDLDQKMNKIVLCLTLDEAQEIKDSLELIISDNKKHGSPKHVMLTAKIIDITIIPSSAPYVRDEEKISEWRFNAKECILKSVNSLLFKASIHL